MYSYRFGNSELLTCERNNNNLERLHRKTGNRTFWKGPFELAFFLQIRFQFVYETQICTHRRSGISAWLNSFASSPVYLLVWHWFEDHHVEWLDEPTVIEGTQVIHDLEQKDLEHRK